MGGRLFDHGLRYGGEASGFIDDIQFFPEGLGV
ncbi:hypothetical protein A2U01_0108055, partial [Trifolium medium]|nr:hypothetical protein [Trifolium medium]